MKVYYSSLLITIVVSVAKPISDIIIFKFVSFYISKDEISKD